MTPLKFFDMLKKTFLNNFLQEVAKKFGYDGIIEGKDT